MSGDLPEPLLDQWRDFVSSRGRIDQTRLEQLEAQLRQDAEHLVSAGLVPDEAFLVALKRVALTDDASREFAQDYAARLWAPREDACSGERVPDRSSKHEFPVMLACAFAAAAAIKVPALFGYEFQGEGSEFYLLNLSFFSLPFLAAFLAWLKRPPARHLIGVAGVFVASIAVVNAYPFVSGGSTQVLTAIHLPVLLWLTACVIAEGTDWRSVSGRMEYVRFTGEWLITYALIALGGGVLSAITVGVFEAIGLQAETFVAQWLVPCGAMGAVVVAAWLVEARRSLGGGLAPMLARVFTPLFVGMLVILVVAVVWAKGFVDVEREVLILFDVLLVIVLALLLYAVSARDPYGRPGPFDWLQLLLVGCALIVDVVALVNIAARLNEYGFTANRSAALGLNVILLVNLVWSAYLQTDFLRSRRGFGEVERWQMRYLPVYALWAAIVIVAFPPLFGFA